VPITQCLDCHDKEQPHRKSEEDKAKADSLDRLYRAYMWATIIGVTGAWVGLCVLIAQTKKMQRQVDYAAYAATATKTAADAALKNAQAVINAERPWIVVTVEADVGTFNFRFQNRGRTPAAIISISWESIIVPDTLDLPIPPQYREDIWESRDLYTRDDAPALIVPYDVRERHRGEWEDIENGKVRLFLYGRIVYSDHLSMIAAPPHETRWCYGYFFRTSKNPYGFLMKEGPTEYRSYT
jgi:hypothetical protein